jgi:ABC-type branched-subunit amino acid transport system substrate-binding protein
MKPVVEILADELNEKGGQLGKKVDVVIENDVGELYRLCSVDDKGNFVLQP